ncbi:MAG: bifunctional phosphoribosyl-AMP cyclohydrolase/phosphoribosyl-ATP diphosphatase HisIE [Bdellovibrionales bacterium]|jgi:phosphoribosyl-ATP pyrophosphohydrolase/phosphoribosyl-AMP cyclohydrolase
MTDLSLDFAKGDGLIPVIIQDAASLRVLMLGYMNEEALAATKASGLVTFYSRSKKRLWQKGETSGHTLRVQDIKTDCDSDALLILATPQGPTCHTGAISCFGEEEAATLSVLADLESTIAGRQQDGTTEQSYTASLFAAGLPRMAQKVGEEGVEVALAATTAPDKLPEEAADLLYHLLVLLRACSFSLKDVMNVLAARANKTGLRP